MKKCGRIYYELSEQELEELTDLVNHIYDYHKNNCIYDLDSTLDRILELIYAEV